MSGERDNLMLHMMIGIQNAVEKENELEKWLNFNYNFTNIFLFGGFYMKLRIVSYRLDLPTC